MPNEIGKDPVPPIKFSPILPYMALYIQIHLEKHKSAEGVAGERVLPNEGMCFADGAGERLHLCSATDAACACMQGSCPCSASESPGRAETGLPAFAVDATSTSSLAHTYLLL